MSLWIEIKVEFSGVSQPLEVKQRLLNLLVDSNVENVVESYFDGVLSSDSPEDVEEAIFSGEDDLPVVIYVESDQEVLRICSLIESNFKNLLNPFVRKLADTELASAWSDETLFETDQFLISTIGTEQENLTTAKHVIKINPGNAFGNGQHASTLAMLKSLETLHLGGKNCVLDLGTGNGVLLIAAAKLGVKKLIGTDLSQDILDEAQENLSLNQITAETFLTTDVPVQRGPFDLVLVNIPVAGIKPLLIDIVDSTTEDARIIMSGFNAADGEAFTRELRSTGLVLDGQVNVRGWVALRFQKYRR